MEEDDKVYICCSRVKDPISCIIEGSTKEVCTDCKEEVWISPATMQTKEKHQGTILCLQCAGKKAEAAKEKPTVEISEEQMKEIANKYHGEFHDNLRKAFESL